MENLRIPDNGQFSRTERHFPKEAHRSYNGQGAGRSLPPQQTYSSSAVVGRSLFLDSSSCTLTLQAYLSGANLCAFLSGPKTDAGSRSLISYDKTDTLLRVKRFHCNMLRALLNLHTLAEQSQNGCYSRRDGTADLQTQTYKYSINNHSCIQYGTLQNGSVYISEDVYSGATETHVGNSRVSCVRGKL